MIIIINKKIMNFEKKNYCVVKNAIPIDLCKFIEIQFDLSQKANCYKLKVNSNTYFNDLQVNYSYSEYGTLFGEGLLVYLHEKIESIVKKKLTPTYSFSRIYYKNATLSRHTDRPSCEYSATICIKNDKSPWDLFVEDKQKNTISISLNVGDMLIYKGRELPHWREAYDQTKQIQIFLHYVDENGPYASSKYDNRPLLAINK
jgi:hypothetical protein